MFELIFTSVYVQISVLTLIMLLVAFGLVKYLTYTTPNPNAKIGLNDKDPNHKLKGYTRQDLSIHELRKYDGKNAETNFVIFVAVNGYIFDVTIDRHIYGPGGHYSVLAGRDASRALSTFSISCDALPTEEDLMSDLTLGEMAQLSEWYAQYSERYQCVGRLIRSNQDRFVYDHSDEENIDESDENIDEEIDKYCGIQSEVMGMPTIQKLDKSQVIEQDDEQIYERKLSYAISNVDSKLDDLLNRGHEEIQVIENEINNSIHLNGECDTSQNVAITSIINESDERK